MKIKKILFILFVTTLLFNFKVYAATNLTVSKTSVTKGESFTVSVNVSNIAAWNIHLSATGPVSGCIINQADATLDAMDTNKTFTVNCTATGVGIINIVLSGDVTSAKDGISVMLAANKSVNVVESIVNPTPDEKPNLENKLSKNNNIKSIVIDGYELNKIDNNNYTLIVSNTISSVNIEVTPEDSKATVIGNRTYKLNVGENNIDIIVTSESGAINKTNIKITRKYGYYLEDLKTLLDDKNINDIDIIIDQDIKITKEDLNAIKQYGKLVKFNYYNEEKKLIYSWILDGAQIEETNEFITTISNNSKEIKNISKLTNYAAGIHVVLSHEGKLPKGTKIKIYVGDQFENGNGLNTYHYIKDKNKLESVSDKLKVQNGYIEFSVGQGIEYFVTMADLNLLSKEISTTEKNLANMFIVFSAIELVVILILILIYFLKLKKKNNIVENIDSTQSINKLENNNLVTELLVNDVGAINNNQNNVQNVENLNNVVNNVSHIQTVINNSSGVQSVDTNDNCN